MACVTCDACGTYATKACGRCFAVIYCDAECQSSSWAEHNGVCVAPPPHAVSVYPPPKLALLSATFPAFKPAKDDGADDVDVAQALRNGPAWINERGLRTRERCERMVAGGLIEAMVERLHEDPEWVAPLCRIVNGGGRAGALRIAKHRGAFLEHLTEDVVNLTETSLTVCQRMVERVSKHRTPASARILREVASAVCMDDDLWEQSDEHTCILAVNLMATMLLTPDAKLEAILVPTLTMAVFNVTCSLDMFNATGCYAAAVRTLRFVLSRRLATVGALHMHQFEFAVTGLTTMLFDIAADDDYALLRDLLQCSPLLCKLAIDDDCELFNDDRDAWNFEVTKEAVNVLDVIVNGVMVHKAGVDAVKANPAFILMVNDAVDRIVAEADDDGSDGGDEGSDDDDDDVANAIRLRIAFNQRLTKH